MIDSIIRKRTNIATHMGIGIQASHAAIEIGRAPDKTQLTNQNTPFMAKSPKSILTYIFICCAYNSLTLLSAPSSDIILLVTLAKQLWILDY